MTPIRLSALTGLPERDFLRMAGLDAPLLLEHAEPAIELTKQTWHRKPALPRQVRFLSLRSRWTPGLTQREAFAWVHHVANQELAALASGEGPTWERLAALKPGLQALLVEDQGMAPGYCWSEAWYGRGGFKARMSRLVGYGAEQPGLLATPHAYDLAYERLGEALPRCGAECGCEG